MLMRSRRSGLLGPNADAGTGNEMVASTLARP
jgi:hypothetical protein